MGDFKSSTLANRPGYTQEYMEKSMWNAWRRQGYDASIHPYNRHQSYTSIDMAWLYLFVCNGFTK